MTGRAPPVTDEALRQITTGMMTSAALLVAHEIGLFALLGDGPRTAAEVAAARALRPRAAETMLDVAVAAGFAQRAGDRYALTDLAHQYLVPTSPLYWGHYLDYVIQSGLYSLDAVKKGLLAPAREDVFEGLESDPERAKRFTRWMHSLSMGPALAWPSQISLAGHHTLLDIAGGSGAHAIAAVLRTPGLRAIMLERPAAAEVARETIAGHGVADRIDVIVADMWRDPLPPADVHLYSQIFHGYDPERCLALARKSFAALPPGGLVLVHELLPAEDGAGPPRVVAVNVALALLYAGAKQYTPPELRGFLAEAGFTQLEVRHTFGEWGIVSGRKP